MKRLVIGMLAHVDAGKTTLSEALLYTSGTIRTLGRVDHRDTFLDTDAIERQRGITIFSKQALFEAGGVSFTLLDTPGHADFSAEAERTLQVLDCAVLIISGSEGVQAHTETLWRLLRRRGIPTFLFVNKTDLPGFDEPARMRELQQRLSGCCVDFTAAKTDAERAEACAACDEGLLERWSETGSLSDGEIAEAVRTGRIFPCCFGSALRLWGIDEFLDTLCRYAAAPLYPQEFAARVFKISRDAQGNRLTWLKVTGGAAAVRDALTYTPQGAHEPVTEKISQLRLYSGTKYASVQRAEAGGVYAAAGLTGTFPGQGLGAAAKAPAPLLEPVMRYRVLPPEGCDARLLLPKLRELEEEFPQLHIVWDEALREIGAQLTGPIEIEVFCRLVEERCGAAVTVDTGRILYRETIAAPAVGVGHFEPLRHYAEVVLRLEPLERGSGLVFATECDENTLSLSWQRVVLNCLAQRGHRGVLTGSPLTDCRITLLAGRAHPKHTEGGDFRQAAWRAVRQGLMQAQSVLLEPTAAFRLTVPFEQLGRAIADLQALGASFSPAEEADGRMLLRGRAPLAAVRAYAADVAAYTRGQGRIAYETDGYDPCRDADRVIAEVGYDPLRDVEHTADSVFCSHGAGVIVPWDEVPAQMHLVGAANERRTDGEPAYRLRSGPLDLADRELQAIFAREFGPERRPVWQPPKPAPAQPAAPEPPKKQYLIVDGYNVLFAWEELRALAKTDFDAARARLIDILGNYSAYRNCETVAVFDAYRVAGHRGERFDTRGIHVVYTAEGETGDLFIEKLVGQIGKHDTVRVVTSDALIQLSALRSGVLRVSAREFEEEVAQIEALIREEIDALERHTKASGKHTLRLPE